MHVNIYEGSITITPNDFFLHIHAQNEFMLLHQQRFLFFLVFDSDICAERKISHLNLALDHLSPVCTEVINSDCKQQQMISMCIVCFVCD